MAKQKIVKLHLLPDCGNVGPTGKNNLTVGYDNVEFTDSPSGVLVVQRLAKATAHAKQVVHYFRVPHHACWVEFESPEDAERRELAEAKARQP